MPLEPATTSALIEGGLGIAGGLLGGSGTKRPYGFGFDQSSSFGVSGSSQESGSESYSRTDPDTVWKVQSPYLSNLYSQASNLFSNQETGAASSLIGQGQGALSSLMSPGLNPLMEVYQEQITKGLTDYILPSIRRESADIGMVGGTRQGVAEGQALYDAQVLQNQFAAELYNADLDRSLSAAQSTPALAEAGLGVPWYGLNQYAGVIGSPTILGGGSESYSTSFGLGSSFGEQGSESFSEDATGSQGFIEDTFPDRFNQDKPKPKGSGGEGGFRSNR